MTKLSVNINKVATLRNARGGNNPDVIRVALDCEQFGAQGITLHPRPDERHIRHQDDFCDLVLQVQPAQVTLVPDAPDQLTSNHGWNTKVYADFLRPIIARFKEKGIRVSVFVDADKEMVRYAKDLGADRVELYTEPYAANYARNREEAIAPFIEAARYCKEIGLGLNAGHDLSLQNLAYFHQCIPWTDEVSIGHALICDALYMGLKETIQQYLNCLE